MDRLQSLLAERRGVVTFHEDLSFDDPAFTAFQCLGARGLNPGYAATRSVTLTRTSAAERLARILQFEGKSWTLPGGNPQAPLSSVELTAWLKQAGYPRAAAATSVDQMDPAQFATAVYRAVKP